MKKWIKPLLMAIALLALLLPAVSETSFAAGETHVSTLAELNAAYVDGHVSGLKKQDVTHEVCVPFASDFNPVKP